MHMRNSSLAESMRPMTPRRMASSPWDPGRDMTSTKRTLRSCHWNAKVSSSGWRSSIKVGTASPTVPCSSTLSSAGVIGVLCPAAAARASAAAAACAAASPSCAGVTDTSSPVCSDQTLAKLASRASAASPSTRQSQSLLPVAAVGSMLDPPTMARRPSTANIFMWDLIACPLVLSVALKNATRKEPGGHDLTASGSVPV
mmetsp:Transcript_9614/g.37521  ORF Transcript_9614/g.37521 Transcript_9614/m.37521 type:complete len:200 (-) Transcript_9614:1195-1794(-)